MKQRDSQFTLAQRLFIVNAVLVVLLVLVAITAWVTMTRATHAADRVNATNVPQLQAIAELELNVTRVSLQLRHAILARTPEEKEIALADIGEKKLLLSARLDELGKGMVDADGRKLFASLPGLMQAFWVLGLENVALIQAGQKDEAFVYLVDKTIPARNQLLAPLAQEKKRQGDRLAFRISEIKELAHLGRLVVVGAVVLVALGLIGLAAYLQSAVVRRLGADPADLQRVADAVARGDLAEPIAVRSGDQQSVLVSLRDMRNHLAQVVSGVRSNAEGVATASAEIAQGNYDLSARTEQQASALEETAASMEQLGVAVRQNADHARQANQMALNASSVAVQGGEVVSQVVQTMKSISDSSHRIADILGVIDAIAFQTNILALNAAVEAARAGEQGRGFAVVASEVRTLAQRSAEAAREIKGLINASVQRVEQGTALVDQAGSTMGEVVAAIRRVTELMGAISAASTEQSSGVAQVGEAVMQMDQVTQQNAALVEQMAAASSGLNQQAQALVTAVAVFTLDSVGAHHRPNADAFTARKSSLAVPAHRVAPWPAIG